MQFVTEILGHITGEITEATADPETRSSGKVHSSIYSSARPDLGIWIRNGWCVDCYQLLPPSYKLKQTKYALSRETLVIYIASATRFGSICFIPK